MTADAVTPRQHRIAMVADYFFPGLGGVEMHIWNLAQELIKLGHHVIIITHATEDRMGIRIMTGFVKVYYLPFPIFLAGNPFPGVFHSLPLIRDILLRERIEIIHGHQSTSTLAHEAMFHAKLLGLRTVFTEHSLYEFGQVSSANLNKVLQFTLATCDACIGVSEACRKNLILRANLDDGKIMVTISNAVDASRFKPDALCAPALPRINIVVISRLAYRKGVDLVALVVPKVCAKHANVNFILGGAGPKRLVLDEMVERYALHDRVQLVGEVRDVGKVLVQGSIFLNCSLTESFCIAILEAACAGLLVVSTKVGGVPEVLPPDMICFPPPECEDNIVHGLVLAVDEALSRVNLGLVDGAKNHERIKAMYSWRRVAQQTCELIYDPVMTMAAHKPSSTFVDLARAYYFSGKDHGFAMRISGLFGVFALALNLLLLRGLECVY